MRTFFLIISIFSLFYLSGYSAFASPTNGTIDATNNTAIFLQDSSIIYFLTPLSSGSTIHITDSGVTGSAWSEEMGWIHFNPTNYGGVTMTTLGSGVLTGSAWGENLGWVSFNCDTGTNCASNDNYKVTIGSDGKWSGYAWATNYGWIRFDCGNSGECVQTDWRPASVRAECSDLVDNDGDGATDYPDDTGCTDEEDTQEAIIKIIGSGGGEENPSLCTDPSALNTGGTLPCQYGTYLCFDAGALNFGGSLPCQYPENKSDLCEDHTADNYGGALPCQFASCSGDECTPSVECVGEDCIINPPANPSESGSSSSQPLITPQSMGNILSGFFTNTTATAALLTSGLLSLLAPLFLNPLSLSELILLPTRLWSLLMTAFGLKKRRPPWGVVYDSVTKQPLDPAYVILNDSAGKEVATAITDFDGRYGFFSMTGTFTIVANKTNYEFPSKRLASRTHDELYQNLYFGESISIDKESALLVRNIPLDPLSFDWNEFTKRNQKLTKFYSRSNRIMQRLADILFVAGFVISLVATVTTPVLYNIGIFCLYILLAIAKGLRVSPYSLARVIERETGYPLSFSIVRIYSAGMHQEIAHKVTNTIGQFYALVPNGSYYLTIERKNQDLSYTLVHTSQVFPITHGYINKTFRV